MMTRKISIAALLAFLTLFAAGSSQAQDVQKIVAVVNDEVISGYDLVQRISLTILMSGLPDSTETRRGLVSPTLSRLVEDRLKLQEAARYNLTVSDDEINRTVDRVENQYNIPSGQLDSILERRNVDIQTLIAQIRASLAWDKLIRRRIVPRVNVTDEEIASMQEKLQANKGQNEYLLSEIYIPVEDTANERKVRDFLNDLRDKMRGGATFPRLAQEFSHGPTASRGGEIGWVMTTDLDPELAPAILGAKKGIVSKPIRTSDGYHMVAVRDIRKVLDESEGNARLELSQIVIPREPADGTAGGSQMKLVKSLSGFVDSCDYVPDLIQQIASSGSGKMGSVDTRDLPEKIRDLVRDLQPGQASAPYEDGDSYRIFIVCDRSDDNRQLDSPESIRQAIGAKRIEARARRYLQDLKRDATIETR